ncbi:MAG: hypothetical protein JWO90_164 [Solirubrobacterales bacterium]|jgi:hypothetical protein|nr:hypothetical protein [Solirubrobacterales bacterium]
MHGPLDHVLGDPPQQLMLLTTDRHTGTVTGAVALGDTWDRLLCDLLLDVGRQAREEPGA